MWLGYLAGVEVYGFNHAFLSGHIRKILGHQACHFFRPAKLALLAANTLLRR